MSSLRNLKVIISLCFFLMMQIGCSQFKVTPFPFKEAFYSFQNKGSYKRIPLYPPFELIENNVTGNNGLHEVSVKGYSSDIKSMNIYLGHNVTKFTPVTQIMIAEKFFIVEENFIYKIVLNHSKFEKVPACLESNGQHIGILGTRYPETMDVWINNKITIGQAANKEELDQFLQCMRDLGEEVPEFQDVNYIFQNIKTEAPKIIEYIKPKEE